MAHSLKHENNGACLKCASIMDRYPGLHADLRSWFLALQKRVPTAHVSCAGRGKADQEAALKAGASRAHWGGSAHNWNCALDVFELGGADPKNLYELPWYTENLKPAITSALEWYGAPGAKFPELPHVELKGWRDLAKNGKLKLVE